MKLQVTLPFKHSLHSSMAGMLIIASLIFSVSFPVTHAQELTNTADSSLEQEKLLLAAYEGNPESQFKLGLLYNKTGSEFTRAAYWYKQAARQGMANAQYNLGHFYLQGLGVEQDTSKTIEWWQQSALQDYAPAQHNIGTAYFEGIGVTQNIETAQQWFSRCSELGSSTCQESLATVMQSIAEKGNDPSNSAGSQNQTSEDQIPVTEQNTEQQNIEQRSESEDSPVPVDSTESIDDANADIDSEAKSETESEASEASTEPAKTDNINSIDTLAYLSKDLESTVLANLESSDSFTLISTEDNWQQIQLEDAIDVWCYKQFVEINEQTGTLIGDKVRARTAPSTENSEILTELAIGTELKVLEETEKWVKLAYPNAIAWTPVIKVLESADVEIIARPSETAEPVQPSQLTEQEQVQVQMQEQEKDQTIQAEVAENSQTEQSQADEIETSETESPATATPKLATDIRPIKYQYQFLDKRSDDEWLFTTNPSHYTIALGSFEDSRSLSSFINEKNLTDIEGAHFILSKRGNIEWKYVLFGNFDSIQSAVTSAKANGFGNAYLLQIGNIQEQRCTAWKTNLPSNKKLDQYCSKV